MIKVLPHTEKRSFDITYRSEDVRFSPSGRRLALVATDGCLLLFAVDLAARPIVVEAEVELRSPSLLIPHGVEFLSEDVVAVANRNGNLVFFRIPPRSDWRDGLVIEPMLEVCSPLFGKTGVTRKLRERSLFCGPGSLRLFDGVLTVTCNYLNTVSTLSCQLDDTGLTVQEGVVIAHEGLSVVDGVAISLDGTLMALSDHDHRRVAIYRRPAYSKNATIEEKLHARFEPVCSLTDFDMHFPHGLRFDDIGRTLYAVDAGGRYVHGFESVDGWQTDMRGCTFKTFGVDLEAFDKSQQMVPEEHRILEGGGKGLDIDPSGRVLVVTCRNQSLRFFDLIPHAELPVLPHPLRTKNAISQGAEVALSCLVDDTPGIWRSLVPWLATATHLANIPAERIHVHHVCELSPAIAQLCEKLGVNTHAVSRFDARNVYSNKIVQGATQFGVTGSVVFTDVDVVFAAPPPFHALQGFVAGKPVDMANPPLEILNNIFAKAGVKILGVSSNEYSRNGIHKVFETVIGNFNGGMYVLPANDLLRVSQRWGVWARWLLSHPELMGRWDKHLDQIAFCLAVNDLNMPIRILNNLWNFPTHLDMQALGAEPWILHHHAELDSRMLLPSTSDPYANRAVTRVNEAIETFRQHHGLAIPVVDAVRAPVGAAL